MSFRTWLLGKLLNDDEVVAKKNEVTTGGRDSESIISEKPAKQKKQKSGRVKKNIYLRCGRYNINAHSTGWGTVDTLAQAEYVLEYIKFHGYPKRLTSMNLLKRHMRNSNEYYNAIRRLARTDKEWLERERV